MASLFRANVPYTRPFHGAQGAKTGLCEHSDGQSAPGKCRRPRTRFGTSPEAADYFWVSSEATPSRGSQTVAPRPTPTPRLPEDGVRGWGGGPTWNSASSLPRFRAGTRVSLPGRRRRHRGGGPVLCLWVCWTFKQKEECHRLHLYLVSACPESLGPFSFA